MSAKDLLELLRVKQYVKNLLVFVPLVFSQKNLLGIYENSFNEFLAFLSFCALSSAVYIINDLRDYQKDKIHPIKSKRPLASGKISRFVAILILITLLAINLPIFYHLGLYFFIVSIAYLANGILYTYIFKNLQLFDVFSISFGYIMRIYAGAYAIDVPVSGYLFLTVFFLSLFLAFGKRRYELLYLGERSKDFKKVLGDYSVYYLDQLMVISATLTLVVYTIYVAQKGDIYLRFTIPVVVFGIFRYYHITHNLEKGEPSDDLLQDGIILLSAGAYIILLFLSITL